MEQICQIISLTLCALSILTIPCTTRFRSTVPLHSLMLWLAFCFSQQICTFMPLPDSILLLIIPLAEWGMIIVPIFILRIVGLVTIKTRRFDYILYISCFLISFVILALTGRYFSFIWRGLQSLFVCSVVILILQSLRRDTIGDIILIGSFTATVFTFCYYYFAVFSFDILGALYIPILLLYLGLLGAFELYRGTYTLRTLGREFIIGFALTALVSSILIEMEHMA